jgi:DNA-binding transcriptional regulator YdaS (Cro superfamily)
MTLNDYLKTLKTVEQRHDFAKQCGTSLAYLRRFTMKTPNRRPSAGLCAAIERHSGGAVKRETLRPDIDWTLFERV